MADFPWFPLGSQLPGGRVVAGLLRELGEGQLLSLQTPGQVALTLPHAHTMSRMWAQVFAPMQADGRCDVFHMGGRSFWVVYFTSAEQPIPVVELSRRSQLPTGRELRVLSSALRSMPDSDWHGALYLPREQLCLPMTERSESVSQRRGLAIGLLTGGVNNPQMTAAEVRRYNTLLGLGEVEEFLRSLGVEADVATETEIPGSDFRLPGQPYLEAFLNEHVIDYYRRRSSYEEMGITPPGGILLHGPPGTGKTYTMQRLAEFLGWPLVEIDLGAIGSPYIHQTGVRLRQEFERAAQQPPSIIVMDEIDAMAGNRDRMQWESKVEEISELLRLVEAAPARGILVVATTNRPESLDPAILRRGRFDHHVHVGYPAVQDISDVLRAEFAKRPCSNDLDPDVIAQRLLHRPMSDIGWLVNEAARLAVRHRKSRITAWCVDTALNGLSQERATGAPVASCGAGAENIAPA